MIDIQNRWVNRSVLLKLWLCLYAKGFLNQFNLCLSERKKRAVEGIKFVVKDTQTHTAQRCCLKCGKPVNSDLHSFVLLRQNK